MEITDKEVEYLELVAKGNDDLLKPYKPKGKVTQENIMEHLLNEIKRLEDVAVLKAIKKQVPMEVVDIDRCPSCNHLILGGCWTPMYCVNCGQRLKWETDSSSEKESPVEFVSYSGDYPNLCSGVLVIKVNGKQYALRNPLISGGRIELDDDNYYHAIKGPWEIDRHALPQEILPYIEEIKDAVNDNIEYGCCGGCI